MTDSDEYARSFTDAMAAAIGPPVTVHQAPAGFELWTRDGHRVATAATVESAETLASMIRDGRGFHGDTDTAKRDGNGISLRDAVVAAVVALDTHAKDLTEKADRLRRGGHGGNGSLAATFKANAAYHRAAADALNALLEEHPT